MTIRSTCSACTASAGRWARSSPGVLMASGLGGVGYPEGVTMGGQVMKQIVATLTTFVWSGVISFVLLKIIDATIGLRVAEEQEREGLDINSHGETAYHP